MAIPRNGHVDQPPAGMKSFLCGADLFVLEPMGTLAQARARLGVSWYALYVFPCHLAAEPFRHPIPVKDGKRAEYTQNASGRERERESEIEWPEEQCSY